MVEDARIEKRIKNRYPGLKGPFYRAYKELFNKDFFGVSERPVTSLKLIDRLNLHYKIGPFMNIPFKSEEKYFLDKMDNLASWEDVYRLASELYQYSKDQPTTTFDNMEFHEEYDESYSDDNGEDFGEDSFKEGDGTKGGRSNDPFSETDHRFRENETKLLSQEVYPYVYAYLPNFNYEEFFIDFKTLYSKTDFSAFDTYRENILQQYVTYGYKQEHIEKESMALNGSRLFLDYKEKNQKFIMYLVKEFELKRNAAQYARASVSKAGELDINKFWAYKLKDDLFKRVTKIPNGKNHGMVMFVDWSGSMSGNLESTLEQTLVLADFCRKVKIPFEVYAFTDNSKAYLFKKESLAEDSFTKSYRFSSLPKDLFIDSYKFTLMNLLSYRMSHQEYRTAQTRILQIAKVYAQNKEGAYEERALQRSRLQCIPSGWQLSGTPLNETILVAIKFIKDFKLACKLDIVNTIFLTDGEAAPSQTMFDNNGSRKNLKEISGYSKYNLVLKDRTTGITAVAKPDEPVTTALLKMLKALTDTRLVGYYIMESSVRYHISSMSKQYGQSIDLDTAMKSMKKNKFFSLEGTGYDSYFLVSGKDLKIMDSELDVNSDTTKKGVIKEFIKFQKNKILNRVLLNNFIEKIA